ncbi:Ca2+/Na+ antiporter [Herbihabitans rhizosphaerae]|uniref:Ca2+/Na+ antiporter n=1 Tax=Herbihabitans rhizosphaerae TaxID=1872711 RepID=A0A4Q7L550_9PSEU|nr:hypothetical protein [Herbihabitans rhizosphaerae]RZS44769.1 Ca2+/Na+ antiporter [Herbihabitans rhizosphaerae]
MALVIVAALIAIAVLAPVLVPGFVLTYDMVFTPSMSLVPDALGLGSALPRSVPADAVIALATGVLPGDLVQKIILAAALFAGALGAGRLVPTDSTWTRVIAATAYGWSGYVAERLVIGHWPLLLSYACLPWIAAAGLAMRRREPKATARLILALAPAVLTPPGGLIAAAVAITTAGARRAWITVGIAVVINAPWWVPSVLNPAGGGSDPFGVTAFASRAESWGGPVTSLLGLGGIWNSATVPASRTSPIAPLLILAMVAVALYGMRELARRWGPRPAIGLLLLGAFGVLVAALGALPVGEDVMRWTVANVPGGGLLRDAQKFVAWWALPLAIGFALAVETVAKRRVVLLAAAAALPVAMLPDLAWGAAGRLEAVDYPDDWERVRAVVAADDRPGDVLALPLSTFRKFDWNDRRTQLDPAPRWFDRPTVIEDLLPAGGGVVRGEDPRAEQVRAAIASRKPLGQAGIGWVLVEHGTPGPLDQSIVDGLPAVHSGQWLTLYRVPDPVAPVEVRTPPKAPVLVADFAALALIAAGLLSRVLPAGRFNLTRRGVRSEE